MPRPLKRSQPGSSTLLTLALSLAPLCLAPLGGCALGARIDDASIYIIPSDDSPYDDEEDDAAAADASPSYGSDAYVPIPIAPDASVTDSGTGRPTDAGVRDAGADAGPRDAGARDAGIDAGNDAGPRDAGADAGPRDAGARDAGTRDGGGGSCDPNKCDPSSCDISAPFACCKSDNTCGCSWVGAAYCG